MDNLRKIRGGHSHHTPEISRNRGYHLFPQIYHSIPVMSAEQNVACEMWMKPPNLLGRNFDYFVTNQEHTAMLKSFAAFPTWTWMV